ncbi:MAG: hypothetical protein P8X42_06680, partial [Calditrichaceae bacterium]
MKLGIIQKLGGIALIAGSVLLTIYSIFFFTLLPVNEIRHDFTLVIQNPNWIWITSTAYIGVILMIFGFTAVYTKIYKDSGLTGLLGYIIIILAYLFQACKVTWEVFLYPVIALNQKSAFLFKDFIIQNSAFFITFRIFAAAAIFIGIILFCIALVRSKAVPTISGILIFFGAI